jgi:hypothetical protein
LKIMPGLVAFNNVQANKITAKGNSFFILGKYSENRCFLG